MRISQVAITLLLCAGLTGCGASSLGTLPPQTPAGAPQASVEHSDVVIDGVIRSAPLWSSRVVASLRGGAAALHVRREGSGSQLLYASNFEGWYFEYQLPGEEPFCDTQLKDMTINAIGATADGTLWLPIAAGRNFNHSGIYSFAADCGSAGNVLSVPHRADPTGIAFSSGGTKYGLMIYLPKDSSKKNKASVEVYPPGATSPQAEFKDPRLGTHTYHVTDAVGVDNKGNVYVSCCGTVYQFVIVFKGTEGTQHHGKQILLSGISSPGGSISFDSADNMIIPDMQAESALVYAPPYNGSPTAFSLRGTPYQCGLSPQDDEFACTNQDAETVDIYSYPAMTYEYSLAVGDPSVPVGGVAFVPSY